MSGNAECAWAVAEKQRIIDVCKQFARKVGWKKNGEGREYHVEMLNYLRTLPAKIFEGSIFSRNWINASRTGIILAPVIDGDFLPKSIKELRKEAPIKSCIVGTCKYESLVFAAISHSSFTLRGIDKILNSYISAEEYDGYEELRRKTKNYYLNNIDINNKLAVARTCEEANFYCLLISINIEIKCEILALSHYD
ncbi:unnamed protein product [Acanthocheilonema viteae]|uniref:Carboxylesterase type B domain-containing protein n=1 Tax=Acanthocheilonema viteae TaxID=6277 RepID=A0A498SI14_ACAVI|nr:unnamed protein product [Acanthocheilonema viteae]